MHITHYTRGKNNNFNLIRIVAAYAVLLSHSFPLVNGGATDPISSLIGMTMGSIAVDAFFAISGFLVTSSILNRGNLVEFFWARFLRIYPAMVLMILLTVFCVGVLFTTLSLGDYFASHFTHRYLVRGITLIGGVWFDLPGVFNDVPHKGVINGSLWTMQHELHMYIILAFTWYIFQIMAKSRPVYFKAVIIFIAVAAGIAHLYSYFVLANKNDFIRLLYWFYMGSAFYILKDKIALSTSFFYALLFVMVSASFNVNIFFVVYTISLTYILLYIAYIPAGVVRNYNRVGDYSYGVYIYAFPVQQSVVKLIPGVSVLNMALISTVVTFFLAVISWHFIEKNALALKDYCVDVTHKTYSNIKNFLL